MVAWGLSDFENISIAVGNLTHTHYLRLLSLPRAREVLLDTRIESIIIAIITLLPLILPASLAKPRGRRSQARRIENGPARIEHPSTQPPFPGEGDGGCKHEELSTVTARTEHPLPCTGLAFSCANRGRGLDTRGDFLFSLLPFFTT